MHTKAKYVNCDVEFKDGSKLYGVNIALQPFDVDTDDDDQIMFYACSAKEFIYLCSDDCTEDFRVTTIHHIMENLWDY